MQAVQDSVSGSVVDVQRGGRHREVESVRETSANAFESLAREALVCDAGGEQRRDTLHTSNVAL